MLKNWENNGTEEIALVTPTPGPVYIRNPHLVNIYQYSVGTFQTNKLNVIFPTFLISNDSRYIYADQMILSLMTNVLPCDIMVHPELNSQTTDLGLYSLSGRMSYRMISWSLEATRFRFRIFQSIGNLTGILAATLPSCLSNFKRYNHYDVHSRGFKT